MITLKYIFIIIVINFLTISCICGIPTDHVTYSSKTIHACNLKVEINPDKAPIFKNNTINISYILSNIEKNDKYIIPSISVQTKLPDGFDGPEKDIFIKNDSERRSYDENKFSCNCNDCEFYIFKNHSIILYVNELNNKNPAFFNCTLRLPYFNGLNNTIKLMPIEFYQVQYPNKIEGNLIIIPTSPILIPVVNNKPNITKFDVLRIGKKLAIRNNKRTLFNNTKLSFDYIIEDADDLDRIRLIIRDNEEILPDNVTKNLIPYIIRQPPNEHNFTLEAIDSDNEKDVEINKTAFFVIEKDAPTYNAQSAINPIIMMMVIISIYILFTNLPKYDFKSIIIFLSQTSGTICIGLGCSILGASWYNRSGYIFIISGILLGFLSHEWEKRNSDRSL
jgi:hypothetical protein